MILFIKNNLIKFGLAILLAIILSLNYFGFCFGQFRFLSDEEKRNIVIDHILLAIQYKSVGIHPVKILDSVSNREMVKALLIEPIPYQTREEFLVLNPNCCQITIDYQSIGGEGDTVSCWNRLIGFKSSVVGIRYISRYRDDKGIVHSEKAEIFPSISNCGQLIWELL